MVSGGAKSGSFIKANKVQGGICLAEAIQKKYGIVEGEMQIDEKDIKALQREMNAPFLEMVGFDRINEIQSNFKKLRIVGLKGMRVTGLGSSFTDLKEWIPIVKELDLDDNLIKDWDEMTAIAKQLPLLTDLNLSGNRMALPTDPEAHARAYPKLSHLVLGRMNLSWQDVLSLTQNLPALTDLQCYDNAITEVQDLPEGVFQKLEQLDINSNVFKDWKNVVKFSKLPKLWSLNLNGCGLTKIDLPDTSEAYFPALKFIQLAFNDLNDWQSVSNLLPIKLNEVRIRNNPVLETEKGN